MTIFISKEVIAMKEVLYSYMFILYHLQVDIFLLFFIILDADGLRDYIIDHGWITSFNNPHQSSDDYIILNTEKMNDIDVDRQSQITQLRFSGRYDYVPYIPSLDFSNYHFDQLQSIQFGCFAFLYTREIQFKSNT